MVILNDSSEIHNLNTNRFQENIQDYKSGKDILTEQIVDVTYNLVLSPKSVLILELEN
jgi:hypothetical protein